MIKLKELIHKQFTIYCDLDGVLCDFDAQLKNIGIGDGYKYEEKYGAEAFWGLIGSHGVDWWAKMPWMPDGKKLWDYIKDRKVKILSKPARTLPESRVGKHEWIKNNLGEFVEFMFSYNKEEYADSNSILIDDQENNIKKWKQAGGIGILHKSAIATIKELEKLK